jgi:mRNA-degrading endonuclease RelE of RelBE toxin-antitoxin system
MAMVVVTPEAQDEFHKLPSRIQTRVEKVFARLERWPNASGAKALSGELAGRYRIRTGDYRVQFRVVRGQTGAADTIIVEKVGHRDGFYGD